MANQALYSAIAQVKTRLGLDQLSTRERLSLVGCGLVVVLVIVYQFIVSPYLEARSRLEGALVRKQQELTEIKALSQEYAGLREQEGSVRELLGQREAGFTLFAFLEKQAQSAGIKETIKYMKPSVAAGVSEFDESVVEMRLEGVSLDRLTRFLQLIEVPDLLVTVRRLSMQASTRENGVLDVILQIVTLEEAQKREQ